MFFKFFSNSKLFSIERTCWLKIQKPKIQKIRNFEILQIFLFDPISEYQKIDKKILKEKMLQIFNCLFKIPWFFLIFSMERTANHLFFLYFPIIFRNAHPPELHVASATALFRIEKMIMNTFWNLPKLVNWTDGRSSRNKKKSRNLRKIIVTFLLKIFKKIEKKDRKMYWKWSELCVKTRKKSEKNWKKKWKKWRKIGKNRIYIHEKISIDYWFSKKKLREKKINNPAYKCFLFLESVALTGHVCEAPDKMELRYFWKRGRMKSAVAVSQALEIGLL